MKAVLLAATLLAACAVVLGAPTPATSEEGSRPNGRRHHGRKLSDLAPHLQKQIGDVQSAAAADIALNDLNLINLDDAERYSVDSATGRVFVADDPVEAPAEPVRRDDLPPIFEPTPIDASDRQRRIFSGTNPTSISAQGVPIHHSLPGARNVLYLDFIGYTIQNTAWNSGASATYTPISYDLDGNPGSFSSAEQTSMSRIWSRVAEDYSGFNVDVTTEKPSSFTSTTGRCLITKNVDSQGRSMPSSSAGGVAFVGVFGLSNYAPFYQPAFAYYNNLGSGREDYVAEACSHELGHNLGLSHDGTTAAGGSLSYYGGSGSGATGWAPIMGVSYNKAVTKFNPGDYPNANNKEDDVAIVSAALGFRPDDFADTAASAASLTVSSNRFSATGVIESSSDVDCFAFSMPGAGSISISLTPFFSSADTAGNNLDILATLYNPSNAVIDTDNDQTTSTAQLSASVTAAGSYKVCVRGTGNTATPYSAYASAGQYALTGTLSVSGTTTTTKAPTTTTKSTTSTTKSKATTTTTKSRTTTTTTTKATKSTTKSKSTTTTTATMTTTTTQADQTGCSTPSVITSTNVVINTNVGLQIYNNRQTCAWSVTAPNGMRPVITFLTFATEPNFDVFTIFDGTSASAAVLSRNSGLTRPATVRGSTRNLFITFSSDLSVSSNGVTALVTFVPK